MREVTINIKFNKYTLLIILQSMYNISERCSLEHFNYMLVLEDSRKRMLDQKIVGTDNCIDNLCSSTLLYPPNNNYSLIFGVSNVFGSSRNITSQFGELIAYLTALKIYTYTKMIKRGSGEHVTNPYNHNDYNVQ